MLLALVRRADDYGRAWPGFGTLSAETRVSRTRLIEALAELEARDLFTRIAADDHKSLTELKASGLVKTGDSNVYLLPAQPSAAGLDGPRRVVRRAHQCAERTSTPSGLGSAPRALGVVRQAHPICSLICPPNLTQDLVRQHGSTKGSSERLGRHRAAHRQSGGASLLLGSPRMRTGQLLASAGSTSTISSRCFAIMSSRPQRQTPTRPLAIGSAEHLPAAHQHEQSTLASSAVLHRNPPPEPGARHPRCLMSPRRSNVRSECPARLRSRHSRKREPRGRGNASPTALALPSPCDVDPWRAFIPQAERRGVRPAQSPSSGS